MRHWIPLALALSVVTPSLAQEPPRYRGRLESWQHEPTADENLYGAYLAQAAGARPGPTYRVMHRMIWITPPDISVMTPGLEANLEGLQIQRYDLTQTRELRPGEYTAAHPAELFGRRGRGAPQAAEFVSCAVFVPEYESMSTPFVYEARGPEVLKLYGRRMADAETRERVRAEAWRYRPAQGSTSVWGYYSGDGEWAVETFNREDFVARRSEALLALGQQLHGQLRGEAEFHELRPGSSYRPSRLVVSDDVLEAGPDHVVVRWDRRVVEVRRTGHGYRWIMAHDPERLDDVEGVLPTAGVPVDPDTLGAGGASTQPTPAPATPPRPVKGIVDCMPQ